MEGTSASWQRRDANALGVGGDIMIHDGTLATRIAPNVGACHVCLIYLGNSGGVIGIDSIREALFPIPSSVVGASELFWYPGSFHQQPLSRPSLVICQMFFFAFTFVPILISFHPIPIPFVPIPFFLVPALYESKLPHQVESHMCWHTLSFIIRHSIILLPSSYPFYFHAYAY